MKRLLATATILFAVLVSFAQPDWNRVNQETSTIFTGIVTVNGENANSNDLIGIFVGNECRMASKIIEKDGATIVSAVIHSIGENETATIKYWNSYENEIIDVDTVVKVSNHGSVKDFPINIKDDDLSITKIEEEETLDLYPTPFISAFFVRCANDMKTISVYDNKGSLIKKESVSGKELLFDVDVPKGVYLVEVLCSNGLTITKEIIKK